MSRVKIRKSETGRSIRRRSRATDVGRASFHDPVTRRAKSIPRPKRVWRCVSGFRGRVVRVITCPNVSEPRTPNMSFLKKTHAPARAALVATAFTFSLGVFIGFLVARPEGGMGGVEFFPSRNERPPPVKWDDAPSGISLSVGFPAWAGCPHPPCAYSSLEDGPVNATVRWRVFGPAGPGPRCPYRPHIGKPGRKAS